MSVQYAAEHFEDLVFAVQNGEDVEIASEGRPALLLVRSIKSEPVFPAGKRILGVGTALAYLPGEEELERIDREWKRELEGKTFA